MTRNIWSDERIELLKEITSEFLEEGYLLKEARSMAKREVDEVMSSKMNVVDDIFNGEE